MQVNNFQTVSFFYTFIEEFYQKFSITGVFTALLLCKKYI